MAGWSTEYLRQQYCGEQNKFVTITLLRAEGVSATTVTVGVPFTSDAYAVLIHAEDFNMYYVDKCSDGQFVVRKNELVTEIKDETMPVGQITVSKEDPRWVKWDQPVTLKKEVCKFHGQREPRAEYKIQAFPSFETIKHGEHGIKDQVDRINVSRANEAISYLKSTLREWPICQYGGTLKVEFFASGMSCLGYWICSHCK